MGSDRTGCHVRGDTVAEMYSGNYVDVADMKPEDVNLRDVAHALANTCRYGGHCKQFFSVAAHSNYCYDEAKKRGLPKWLKIAILLHDGGEAYWHDLGRPHKIALGRNGYNVMLDKAQACVEQAVIVYVYEAAIGNRRTIKEIDNAVMAAEVVRLMPSKGKGWRGLDEVEAVRIPWWKWLWYRLPGRAEAGFMRRLRECGVKV